MTEEAQVADQIQIRRDTASNWSSNNPTLAPGEQGWESDTNKMKVGDGSTAWNSLSYFHSQNYQTTNSQLTSIAGLTPTDGNFIVGDGSDFVTESGTTVRASLGLTIGTDVQAYDAQLADIAGLNPTDGNFIVGDGSNFVLESGATARTSLGLGTIATAATSDYAATANNLSDLANASTARTNLGVAIGTDVQAYDAQLADIAGLNPTDGYIIVGDGSNFVTENGATARSSLGLTIGTDVLAHDANLSSFVSTFTLPTSDGTNGQALITDGSGTLSFSTISGGGGGGSFTATADGAISDGDTIIIQSDGTVKSVVVAETFAAGTAASPGTIIGSLMIPDTSTALVFWSDSGIKCAVATITASTNAISLGATQTVTSNVPASSQIHPVWDPDTSRAVLFYRVNNTGLVAIAMSISGNTVTAGTQVTINSDNSTVPIGMIYDTNRNEYIAFGVHQDNGIHGYVGTISGTTLTFGSGIEVEGSLASNTYYYWSTSEPGDVEWDPVANRFYIAYRRQSNYSGYSQTMYHKSGSSSGTAFSFGSAYTNSTSMSYSSDSWQGFGIRRGSIVNIGENKFAIGGKGRGGYTSNYSHAVAVYTVNSSSYGITKGSYYTPHSGATSSSYNLSLGYNSDNGKIVASIYDNTNSNAPAKVGTISGTTITFGDAITTSGGTNHYWDYNSSIERYILNAQIINQSSVTNLTTENFVGISSSAVSDGGTATIQIGGSVDDAQSGLTAGQSYFVQGDGTLGLSPDTIPVFAGTALSATELLIKGNDNDQRIGSSVQAYDSNLTSFVNTFTLPTSDGSANQVLQSDGSGTLSFTDVATGFEKSYRYSGTLATNTGSLRLYLHKAATLSEINLFVQTAPSGSAINLDINKNGSSIATPSIADGQTSNTGISANVSFAVGDYITVDIDQVGSGTAGSDLYAVLTFT